GQLLLLRAFYDPSSAAADQQVIQELASLWALFGLAAAFFVPSFAAALAGRSFRSGLRAGIWAAVAILPFPYALCVYEALRLHPLNGGLLWFGAGAPEGENLGLAITWSLRIIPLLGLPFAVIGAAAGTRAARPGRLSTGPCG